MLRRQYLRELWLPCLPEAFVTSDRGTSTRRRPDNGMQATTTQNRVISTGRGFLGSVCDSVLNLETLQRGVSPPVVASRGVAVPGACARSRVVPTSLRRRSVSSRHNQREEHSHRQCAGAGQKSSWRRRHHRVVSRRLCVSGEQPGLIGRLFSFFLFLVAGVSFAKTPTRSVCSFTAASGGSIDADSRVICMTLSSVPALCSTLRHNGVSYLCETPSW